MFLRMDTSIPTKNEHQPFENHYSESVLKFKTNRPPGTMPEVQGQKMSDKVWSMGQTCTYTCNGPNTKTNYVFKLLHKCSLVINNVSREMVTERVSSQPRLRLMLIITG